MAATLVFRQHDTGASLASPLLSGLGFAWADLNSSLSDCAAVEDWSVTYAALAGLRNPGQIVDHIDASPWPVKDAVTRALLDLLHRGDQLAGQVLLQAMLPGLCNLARRCRPPRGEDHEETLQRVIAEFWAVISRPKLYTCDGVLKRLRADTLNQVTSHRRSSDAWEAHTSHDPEGNEEGNDSPASLNDFEELLGEISDLPNPDGSFLELMLWCRRSGHLTGDDVRFLAEVYVVDDGDQKAAAERLSLPYAGTRKRCSRLRARIAHASCEALAMAS